MKIDKITPSLTRGGSALAPLSERSRFSGRPPALLFLVVFALILMMAGCAGSIFSHKPYNLPAGRVIEASPKKVLTEWPKDHWYFCGPGNTDLCQGNFVTHVCPETVPPAGTTFARARVTWDKPRKCWQWESE